MGVAYVEESGAVKRRIEGQNSEEEEMVNGSSGRRARAQYDAQVPKSARSGPDKTPQGFPRPPPVAAQRTVCLSASQLCSHQSRCSCCPSAFAALASCPCLTSFPFGVNPANGITIGGVSSLHGV